MLAPICTERSVQMGSSFLPICLLLLLLACPFLCESAPQRSCRLLKLLASSKLGGHARHLLDAQDHQVRRGA